MIFHENYLLPDDSREISYFIFSKIRKDVTKFAICCHRDWRLRVNPFDFEGFSIAGS